MQAAFTHAVIAPGAAERISAAGFGHVLTTDSIPVQPAAGFEIVPVAPLLTRAVRGGKRGVVDRT